MNRDIRATEVRVVGIVKEKVIEETNEVMSFTMALEKAEEMGVDVILINEEPLERGPRALRGWMCLWQDQDPPLVKIASASAALRHACFCCA